MDKTVLGLLLIALIATGTYLATASHNSSS